MMLMIAGGLGVLYYVATAIVAYRKLRHFPGPLLASFSFWWLLRVALSGEAYKIHMAARKRYGGRLVRIGPDTLITDDPEIVQRINGVHNGYARGDWYSVMRLDPYIDNMISSLDTAFHDDIKAKTQAGYTGREVPSMERDIDGQVAALKRLIRRRYLSGRPMDWSYVAQYFILDSLTKVAYGEEFGCLEADDDVNGYIKTVESSGFYFAVCSDVPWIGRIFLSKFLLGLIGPKPTDSQGMGAMMALAERIVRPRFIDPYSNQQQDILASFIRHGLPQKQCESEILAHLVAGSDTTSNYLRVALVLLAATPRVYQRLREEIDQGISSGRISNPITGAEAAKLEYLQGFLWETFRFAPPVFMLFPKVVPPEGDILDGKFVPGGTKIAIDTWSMGRRIDIYGPDVDIFRPERFTEAAPGKRAGMEKAAELIFGAGRYLCPGKGMALLELNKVFVELLRDFDFQILNPEKPLTRSHRAMFLIRGVQVLVTERLGKR